jgi:TolA-binding protein
MKRIIVFCLLLAGLSALPAAFAGTKEDIERIKNDINTMQNQILELAKNFNEKTDGIKSLVVQLNDQVAKSNLLLEKISALLESQSSTARAAEDSIRQDMSKLDGKMNDFSTRISALAQQINDLKRPAIAKGPENPPGGNQSPELMYNQAYRDFVAGNIDLAIQEYNAYLDVYPGGDKAALALLNLGDAYMVQKKLPQASIAFTRIINNYSDTNKVPSAMYKRAQVELAIGETQNAIDDLKTIVDRYPLAQEVDNAKAKLLELGVGAAKPAPAPTPAPTRRKSR